MKTLAELQLALAEATRARQNLELSDNRCFSSGRINPLLLEEARLRYEIRQ